MSEEAKRVVKDISSHLSGDKEQDREYLLSEAIRLKDTEVLDECLRMLFGLL